ncbi:Nramp family divalent metal transporter, partial [Micrococcus luteus]|nr:Nramp family divalent metal transporter [Micrococcus luteus]
VMPHAIYVHSALARDRHQGAHAHPGTLGRLLRATRWDVGLSLLVAGSVNIAMLLLAAANLSGVSGTDSIEGAHAAITTALGPAVGVLFGVGLLASGLASTAVGSYAGSEIMGGLLRWRIPQMLRRVLTLIPALLVIASGVDPTWALVLSQVLLSIGIPFAMIPLVRLTGARAVMGRHANSTPLQTVAWVVVALIVALNAVLLWLTLTGQG